MSNTAAGLVPVVYTLLIKDVKSAIYYFFLRNSTVRFLMMLRGSVYVVLSVFRGRWTEEADSIDVIWNR